MDTYNRLKKEFKEDWYIQGFNSVPLFLNFSAWSGFPMKEELGYGYSKFIFNYKKGYGEMGYLNQDFKRIWEIIKSKTKENPDYLKQVKKKYEEIFREHEEFFKEVDDLNPKEVDGNRLVALLKKCTDAQTASIGLGHTLDSIGLEIDKEFKKELEVAAPDKKERNRCYAILTTPSELSFIAQEEKELRGISESPESDKQERLKKHFKKYFWIQNSYAGPKKLTIQDFEKRLKSLKEAADEGRGPGLKNELVQKLKLDQKVKDMIKIIDFTTVWQDQRKANALKTVGYLGKIVDEVSKRTKIDKEPLYYLGVTDVSGLDSLEDIKRLKEELNSRVKGVFFLMEDGTEQRIIGREYNDLIEYREKLTKEGLDGEEDEIHGSIANGGTAIGDVVICKDLASIKKVKKGDVLVASMTRPEFMPAIKKAAAIVTDEGGITCHAAIVARELNIPAVIGTKIATKKLKDNMIVEVKANHGVVKILKD